MNKNAIIVVLSVACALLCTVASYFIGYNIGKDAAIMPNAVADEESEEKEIDLVGVWRGVGQSTNNAYLLYLNDDGSCSGTNVDSTAPCRWSRSDSKVVISIGRARGFCANASECSDKAKEYGDDSEIMSVSDWGGKTDSELGYVVVKWVDSKYTIINDGNNIMNDSGSIIYSKVDVVD